MFAYLLMRVQMGVELVCVILYIGGAPLQPVAQSHDTPILITMHTPH